MVAIPMVAGAGSVGPHPPPPHNWMCVTVRIVGVGGEHHELGGGTCDQRPTREDCVRAGFLRGGGATRSGLLRQGTQQRSLRPHPQLVRVTWAAPGDSCA
jgi:hypothetical protein